MKQRAEAMSGGTKLSNGHAAVDQGWAVLEGVHDLPPHFLSSHIVELGNEGEQRWMNEGMCNGTTKPI